MVTLQLEESLLQERKSFPPYLPDPFFLRLHDDLAMLVGINGHLSKSPMSSDDMERVCSDTWSSVDCALFEHFNASLWAKVEAGGEDFAEEVREVRHTWSTLDTCCEDNSCARLEQIEACDRIRDSVRSASEFPTIIQF